jgi:integrase
MPKAPEPRKKGNRWEINYIDAGGRRRWRTFRTKREAQKALHHLNAEAEAIRAGVVAMPPEPHTFGELADYWLEKKAPLKRSAKDDKSIVNRHLRPYFGEMQLPAVDAEFIDQFIIDKDGEVGDKTLHNILTLLGTMLRQGVRLKWIVAVPPIDKPRLQEKDYRWLQTNEEIKKVLTAALDEEPGVMVLYATAIYTGMRAGELLGLRWEDVNLSRRLITVKRSYDLPHTKNRGLRHVPVLTPLLRLLKQWRLQRPGPLLFPTQVGTPKGPSDRWLQEVFKGCLDRAEVDRVRFHDLRHTFASHWVMAGGDIFRLQKILGHRDIRMTLRYAHLAPDAYTEDYDRLDDLLPTEDGGELIELGSAEAGR